MSPSRAQMEEGGTVETLVELRDEGKVRFIGMSGILPHLTDHIAMDVFDVFQIPYSALQLEHEDLITAAAARGAGTLIRGGAARGAPPAGPAPPPPPRPRTRIGGRVRWVSRRVRGSAVGRPPGSRTCWAIWDASNSSFGSL
jgi:aryl-alcohol dehydrogenase-like predicted oxidoreductase